MSRSTLKLHDALTQRLGWLRGLARHLVRDDAVADDLVQDTMVAALTSQPKLDRPLEPWLSDVLHRLHRQHRRGSGRRSRREQAAAREENVPDGTELVARLELVQQIVRAVQELPEPFRTTVALRYESGLSPAEIARRLNVNDSTVRWRIHEGLSRLRGRLDREQGSRQAWVTALMPLALAGEKAAAAATAGATAWWSSPLVAALILVTAGVATWIRLSDDSGNSRRGPVHAPVIADAFESNPPRRRSVEPAVEAAVGAELTSTSETSVAEANRTATLRGRVVDEQGRPVAEARVGIVRAAPYALAERSPSLGDRQVLVEESADASGAFTLTADAGLYQLVILDDQNGPTISRPIRVEAHDERTDLVLTAVASRPDLPALESRRAAPTATIDRSLRAVWLDGRPAAGLRVTARIRYGADRIARTDGFHVLWQEPLTAPTTTDASGSAVVSVPDGVEPSELGFEFFDTGGSLGVVPCPADPRLAAVVNPRASLAGSVRQDASESAQPEAIGLSNGDGLVHTSAIADGSFAFPALPAGRYELRWLDSYRPSGAGPAMVFVIERQSPPPRSLLLRPGDSATLNLDRLSLPLVEGQVRIDGEIPSQWQIDILPPATSDGVPDLVQSALPLSVGGEFRIRVPRTATYELRLTTANGARVAPLYVRQVHAAVDSEPFELSLQTCIVTGRWKGQPPSGQLWLRTRLADGGVWLAPMQRSPDGALYAPRAAPGSADVVLADHDAATARIATSIAQLQVPRGGLTNVILP